MTLQEFIKTGKRGRISGSSRIKSLGTIEETDTGVVFTGEDGPQRLSILEIFSDQWEIERLPRTFYLGITKIQSHMKEFRIMQAIESIDKPPGRDSDGHDWVKVVEILENV